MVHPDHEVRLGAHRIFSVVLVPSSISPCQSSTNSEAKKGLNLRTLSRTVSVFSSSAALFEKLRKEKTSFKENSHQDNQETVVEGEEIRSGKLDTLKLSYSRVYSVKNSPAHLTTVENPVSNKETVSYGIATTSLNLSSMIVAACLLCLLYTIYSHFKWYDDNRHLLIFQPALQIWS